MKLRVVVVFVFGKSLEIVEIDVVLSKKGEVLIKVIYIGVCYIDVFIFFGDDSEGVFSVVFGYEGVGVVVEVGEGVISVKFGDYVISFYIAECGECEFCRFGKINFCVAVREIQGKGLMLDGIIRFFYNGQSFYYYMGCFIFSEYIVVAEVFLVKINLEVNYEYVCLLGCGVIIGIGAVYNIVKVQLGDFVVVFGFGAIGLVVVQGARQAKAGRIIVIDINSKKFDLARRFGVIDCINSNDYDKSIKDVLLDINKWGIDYIFECIGNVNVMRAALESAYRGWGQSVIIGVAVVGQEIFIRLFQLVIGRVWKGFAFGGVKGRFQLSGMVEDAMKGDIDLESFVTYIMSLDEINDVFDLMYEGKFIRIVIRY